MQIKTVSIRLERTYDLGSYESIKAAAFLHADIEEDECPSDCLNILTEQAKAAIKKAVYESVAAREAQRKQAETQHRYMGKAIENGSNWTSQVIGD